MVVYYSSSVSSSIFRVISRMVEEEEEEIEGTVQWNMLKVNKWCPRIDGVVTLVSSLCMMWMAWNRRGRLFHHLVLGMSINQFINGIFFIYGPAAIPAIEANYPLYSSGTIATCTTQGFFLYSTGITGLLYYSSFSVYSYVGVLNNFKKSKIIWVEKYIHLFVHIYPICCCFYILSQEGFNDSGSGFCYLHGNPVQCWYDPDVSCERGPKTTRIRLIYIITNMLLTLCPSIIMAVLFLRVKKRQNEIFIDAISVAKQGVIYLVVLYWIIVPFLIALLMSWLSIQGGNIDYYIINNFWIFVNINFGVFPLWSMLSYLYFSMEKKTVSATVARNDNNSKNNVATENPLENDKHSNISELKASNGFIFTSQEIESQDTPLKLTSAMTATTTEAQEPKYSFNIFDGSNAKGDFQDFIHEGDSDDERIDNEQTDRWADVQDHI